MVGDRADWSQEATDLATEYPEGGTGLGTDEEAEAVLRGSPPKSERLVLAAGLDESQLPALPDELQWYIFLFGSS